MTIEVSQEVEDQIRATASSEGLSVGEYVARLVTETNSRRVQAAEFRVVMAERLASLSAGETADGEEVMAKLISELGNP
jgi:hypothetical protein